MKTRLQYLLLAFFLIVSTIGCDQITKALARARLSELEAMEFLGGFVTLQYAENTGAFLSLGASLPEAARFWMFTIGAGALLLATVLYLLRGSLDLWRCLGLSFLLGGGIGNLIDRASIGHVTDFINIGLGFVRTGIFNIADVAILLGTGVIFWRTYRPVEKIDPAI